MSEQSASHRAMLAAPLCAAWPGREQIGWDALAAWPDWALPTAQPDAEQVALRTGAQRDASRLRACIDGSVLQAAAALLGDAALNELLRDAIATQADPGALAPPAQLGEVWRDAGRCLLLDAIADKGLRGAVAAHLGWPLPESAA